MTNTLGRHILVEFYGCNAQILNDVVVIEKAMVEAAEEAQATVINSTFHHFSPYGVSGVVVIQESHLAIHAWPEYQYAAVDIFTCGTEVNPWVAYDFLKKALEADHGSAMEINRGQKELLKRINTTYLEEKREEAAEELKPAYKRDVWFTDKDDNVALSLRHTGNLLYHNKSEYQTVRVFDTYAYGKMLSIDNMVMLTEKDEFIYHEMISHVPTFVHGNVKKVLVIGGGDGGTIRELFKHEGIEKIVMVEIDKNVVEASKLHLPTVSVAFDNPKLELKIADGIQYLKNCPPNTFDLIVIDGSDPKGPAEGLFSDEFYQDAYKALAIDGIICLQSESPMFNTAAFLGLNKCMRTIFGAASTSRYLAFIPTYPSGIWSFTIARKSKELKCNEFDRTVANAFFEKHQLQYYTPEIHLAAFALPPFIKKMLTN